MQTVRHSRTVFVLLVAFLFLMLVLNIATGSADVSASLKLSGVLNSLLSHLPVISHYVKPQSASFDIIVWQLRIPRALAGATIGMLLAMAGVAFQSFLMNPLADPYMVGVSAGSALGSAIIILLGGAGWLSGLAMPLAAFVAGIGAMLLVTMIAKINGRISVQTFLLAGFVLGTFIYSLTKLAVAIANRSSDSGKANQILAQLLGSLQTVSWQSLWILLPFGFVGALLLGSSVKELNLMALGEESAARLGVDTEKFKNRIIVAGSLATAATVAIAGIIGFVGMVVPHIARRLVGPDHKLLLPAAMLLGGIVLISADFLSRVALGGLEIGVVTSLFGAPVFCFLLRKRLVTRW